MVSLPCVIHSFIQVNECCVLSFHSKGTQQLRRTGPFPAPWEEAWLGILNTNVLRSHPSCLGMVFLNALALLVGDLLGASFLRGSDRSKLGVLWAFVPPLAGVGPTNSDCIAGPRNRCWVPCAMLTTATELQGGIGDRSSELVPGCGRDLMYNRQME